MVKALRIIAADFSSAILNEKFQPQSVVAAAAVLVNPPYREPKAFLAKSIFEDVKASHNLFYMK